MKVNRGTEPHQSELTYLGRKRETLFSYILRKDQIGFGIITTWLLMGNYYKL